MSTVLSKSIFASLATFEKVAKSSIAPLWTEVVVAPAVPKETISLPPTLAVMENIFLLKLLK